MLEFTYYNTEKIDNLKDFFIVAFVLIDDIYNEIISVLPKKTYFGLKLHALISTNGYITNFIVTTANVDIKQLYSVIN